MQFWLMPGLFKRKTACPLHPQSDTRCVQKNCPPWANNGHLTSFDNLSDLLKVRWHPCAVHYLMSALGHKRQHIHRRVLPTTFYLPPVAQKTSRCVRSPRRSGAPLL